MIFQNDQVDLGTGMVFCCELHGKIPKEQVIEFHPVQQAEPSSKEKYEAKRRQKRQYKCKDCNFTFQGSGSWQQAAEHEWEWHHTITQGPDRKRKTWILESVTA
jgi:hypothetical protein